MTDKIIIDGVDVAGCNYLSEVENDYCCSCQYEEYAKCEGYACYYKQLQRLQQENEELKIYIESNKQQVKEVETLVMDNDRLLQENERLQAELKKSRKLECKFKEHYCTCNTEKYQQALEEIREIINCRFKPETEYYTLGFKEYDEIIEDIDKIIIEVSND